MGRGRCFQSTIQSFCSLQTQYVVCCVYIHRLKPCGFALEQEFALLQSNASFLRYYFRLSPICSVSCSLVSAEKVGSVTPGETSGSFQGWEKLMTWAFSPAPGTYSICSAAMQKVRGTTRQNGRLLNLYVFADIQKWFAALDTDSQPLFFRLAIKSVGGERPMFSYIPLLNIPHH